MIIVRRAHERDHERGRKQEVWRTFYARDQPDQLASGFGAIDVWREHRLAPRAAHRYPRENAEIITYVREGTLSYQDSTGQSGLIAAGEFQRMTAGKSVRYEEANASPTDWAHVFQICLRPRGPELEPGHEQKRFSAAERRGHLCLVASPDARDGSLRVHQDAYLFSAIVERGQHVVHELGKGRGAWLHVVAGAVTLGGVVMNSGDGVGITSERSVSFTAGETSEVLLLDLTEIDSRAWPLEWAS
jgi:hypothetical protein